MWCWLHKHVCIYVYSGWHRLLLNPWPVEITTFIKLHDFLLKQTNINQLSLNYETFVDLWSMHVTQYDNRNNTEWDQTWHTTLNWKIYETISQASYLRPEDIFIPQQCRNFSTCNIPSAIIKREYDDMKAIVVCELDTKI